MLAFRHPLQLTKSRLSLDKDKRQQTPLESHNYNHEASERLKL